MNAVRTILHPASISLVHGQTALMKNFSDQRSYHVTLLMSDVCVLFLLPHLRQPWGIYLSVSNWKCYCTLPHFWHNQFGDFSSCFRQ